MERIFEPSASKCKKTESLSENVYNILVPFRGFANCNHEGPATAGRFVSQD